MDQCIRESGTKRRYQQEYQQKFIPLHAIHKELLGERKGHDQEKGQADAQDWDVNTRDIKN
jgi:hypothetical protein